MLTWIAWACLAYLAIQTAWWLYTKSKPSATSTSTAASLLERAFDASTAVGITATLLAWRYLSAYKSNAAQAAIKTLYDAAWAEVWEPRVVTPVVTIEPAATTLEGLAQKLAALEAVVSTPVVETAP